MPSTASRSGRRCSRGAATLGDLMVALADERLAALGVGIASLRDGARRGNRVSPIREGFRIMQALIARGIIGDFRAPDVSASASGRCMCAYVDVFDADQSRWRKFSDPALGRQCRWARRHGHVSAQLMQSLIHSVDGFSLKLCQAFIVVANPASGAWQALRR